MSTFGSVVLVFLGVSGCVLAVAFTTWFVHVFILDARKTWRNR